MRRHGDSWTVNQRRIPRKEEKLMATLNIPISELRPAPMGQIWVIEDEGASRKILRRLLSSEGYEVEGVPDGIGGMEMLREKPPSAVMVDQRHPGSSRCDHCKKVANLIPGLLLAILSTSSDVADEVVLPKMSTDDSVTIPFDRLDLVGKLRALGSRASRMSPENSYVFEDVMVDFAKAEITRGGEKITVTVKEFKTLEFLTKNAERVVSRDELLNKVWGYQNYPCTRTVDTHIQRLRQKLESDPSHPSHILTVRGMGYKFVP
jgi:two-component system, OmpR family, alkaline phosphatase synthesis response regulator PhoP